MNKYCKTGLVFLTIKVLASHSNILFYNDLIDNILSVAGFLLLIFSMSKDNIKGTELKVYIGLFAAGLLTCVCTRSLGILLPLMICLAVRKLSVNRAIGVIYKTELIYMSLHTGAALIMTAFNVNMVTDVSGEDKFNFGFRHPNVFSCVVINLILMWVWFSYKRISRKHEAIILGIICGSYVFTGTRTAVLIVILFIFGIEVDRLNKFDLSRIAAWCVPGCALMTLVLSLLYPTQNIIVQLINKVLSNRIRLNSYWLYNCGLSLFGKDITKIEAEWEEVWQLSGNVPMDNVYSYIYIGLGVIWLVLISVAFLNIMGKKSNKISLFIIIWALYGMMETHGINPIMFFPIIFVSQVGRRKKSIQE